jgi:hypothetical protein
VAVVAVEIGQWELAVAAVAAAVLGWWVGRDTDPERWGRGAAAEVATAELLARLPRRFVVLHDRRPPGARGNIDHLVVGPSGVWVIDSKARRAVVSVRRGHVWAGDHAIDPGPAARQAASVERALGVPVNAIVAVHGQGLRRRGRKVNGVRMVPADRLGRRIRRRQRGQRLPHSSVVVLAGLADRHFPQAPVVRRTRG